VTAVELLSRLGWLADRMHELALAHPGAALRAELVPGPSLYLCARRPDGWITTRFVSLYELTRAITGQAFMEEALAEFEGALRLELPPAAALQGLLPEEGA